MDVGDEYDSDIAEHLSDEKETLVTKKSPTKIFIRLDMSNQIIIYPNYISILKPKHMQLKE